MQSILAIDPAWTTAQPSGVTLLRGDGRHWECLGLAPSYGQFIALAGGTPVDWAGRPSAGVAPTPELLGAARTLLGGAPVDVVTVDMPVATVPITKRRHCDSAISVAFGRQGCSTYSPDARFPGPVGAALQRGLADAGYAVATVATAPGTSGALVEVYPHPALIALLDRRYRVPYKIGRAHEYWPQLSVPERRRRIVRTWRAIYRVLARTVSGAALPLPTLAAAGRSTNGQLKRYEDALDALVCGWVGIEYLAKRCVAYGDATAAIWTP